MEAKKPARRIVKESPIALCRSRSCRPHIQERESLGKRGRQTKFWFGEREEDQFLCGQKSSGEGRDAGRRVHGPTSDIDN